MAKKNDRRQPELATEDCGLPAMGEPAETIYQVDPPDTARSAEETEPVQQWVTIRIPLGRIPLGGYCPKLVQSRLSRTQGATLARLAAGLNSAHARLARGTHVEAKAQAVLWLLDEIERIVRDDVVGKREDPGGEA